MAYHYLYCFLVLEKERELIIEQCFERNGNQKMVISAASFLKSRNGWVYTETAGDNLEVVSTFFKPKVVESMKFVF